VATITFYTQRGARAVALQIAPDLSFDWLTVRANCCGFAAASIVKRTEDWPRLEQ
jgi:hypothetical protein